MLTKKAKSQSAYASILLASLAAYLLYAESFFLPIRLLLDKIFLPDAVLILFLKPCSLLLWRFLG